MILHSWNVNGLRAVVGKGFEQWLATSDLAGIQETRLQQGHEDGFTTRMGQPDLTGRPGLSVTLCSSQVKKGYSGVGVFARNAPLAVHRELPDPRFQGEGRLIHLEYPAFHFFTLYVPNSQRGPERLDYKLAFCEAFLVHAQALRQDKPIVVCGDFNTAHADIDLKHPEANRNSAGFLPAERAWMDRFIAKGYVDTFRMFEPGPGHYTWWDYRFPARARNVGWRIDYFFVSEELRGAVKRAWIEPDIMGSDHCPVGLELDIS